MGTILQFSFVLLLFQVIAVRATTEKIVFCYWGTWSHYRNGNGNYKVNNITWLDTWLDEDLHNLANTVALKQQNPGLKVLEAVGGWNEGSIKYSTMADDATKRLNFINSALALLHQNDFDGLDLDWEYPAQRDGISADRQNFVILLKELKQA
ncbi:probable chitinase 2 [Teleopsis dalmanni]|nr:probable chitinase 2 [Teleopsis dalmanni]